MSFFRRSCKTDMTSHCPRCEAQDKLHHCLHSLKTSLQQHTSAHLPPERSNMRLSSAALCTVGLAALAGAALYASRSPRVPEGIRPVENFDLDRYLGKWYELARIDHSFEKGLQRTQAEYSRNHQGGIDVTNRGYDPKRGEWKISRGRAKPTIAADIAALKVSFFGPFYAGYNVVALDDDYQWAMVIGSSLKYFWILSRSPSLPKGVEERLLHQAHRLGVDTQKILWVHQDGVNPTGSYK